MDRYNTKYGKLNFDFNVEDWSSNYLILIDASSQNINVTLPPIPDPYLNQFDSGKITLLRVDNVSSNTVTVLYGVAGNVNIPVTTDAFEFESYVDSKQTSTDKNVIVTRKTIQTGGTGSAFVLAGDVTSLPAISGVSQSSVIQVGGKTAAQVAQSVSDTQAATLLSTPNTVVKRGAFGNARIDLFGSTTATIDNLTTTNVSGFNATGTIDSSNWNIKVKDPVDTSNTSLDAVNLKTLKTSLNSLSAPITQLQGDATTPIGSSGVVTATVAQVGGKTAAQIAQSVNDTIAATSSNTASTIVKRDASGNFSANNLTVSSVNLSGNATLGTQAPQWSQVQNYVSQSRVNIKSVATIANSNQNILATNFIGLAINGRTLVSGDRIALISQTTALENGVYVVNSNGSISRSSDCAAGIDGNGFVFGTLYGTFANYFYRISLSGSNTTAIFGTDVASYDLHFIIQNLNADNTTLSITGSTIGVKNDGIGTAQLAAYTTGSRVLATNASTKKPEETSISQAQLSAIFTSSTSYINCANYGSDTTGNGTTIPYLTLSKALTVATGASNINLLGGYGAAGTFSPTVDNILIQGTGCDGSQTANITGSITAAAGRTRLKLKDLQLVGTSTAPTPLIFSSGNLGRNYFKNVSITPYTTSPSININNAIDNWIEFDDCDFANAVSIGGAVGTNESYTFKRCRGAIYLFLNKNVNVSFYDCDVVFVQQHTAGNISIIGNTIVNIVSTAPTSNVLYLQNCSSYNPYTSTYGTIYSTCTTMLCNVTRNSANDNITTLTTLSTPIKPQLAPSGTYIAGFSSDGTIISNTLPSAPTKDLSILKAIDINNTNSPYPLTLNESVINVDCSAGSILINLPPIVSVATNVLTKTYIINRTDIINANNLIINCNSGTTDQIMYTPTGSTSYNINTACSVTLTAIKKSSGSNFWSVQSNNNELYKTEKLGATFTSDVTLTQHGFLYYINAQNNNITVTLPISAFGIGTTKLFRSDTSANTVTIVPPAGHTINNLQSYKLDNLVTATCRTLALNNTNIQLEMSSNNTMISQYGCAYGFYNKSQTMINNTYVKINFNSSQAVYDPSSMFDSTSGTKFFAKVSGVYCVSWRYSAYVTANISGTCVWLNGAHQDPLDYQYCQGVSNWASDSASKNIYMNAGDYIEIIVTSSPSGTLKSADVKIDLAQNSVGPGNRDAAYCIVGGNCTENQNSILTFPSSLVDYAKYDPTGMHSLTDTSKIIIQVSGTYRVKSTVKTEYNGSQAGYANCQIIKNGVYTNIVGIGANGGGIVQSTIDHPVNLIVGDVLQLYAASANSVLTQIALASFSVELCTGVPQNLPTLGTPNQVLAVNSSGNGLSYVSLANANVSGILGRRQSTGQTINNATGTIVTFDTVDTEVSVNSSNIPLSYNNGIFTNTSASNISMSVSWQINYISNSVNGRYTWIDLASGTRLGMQACQAMTSDGTVIASSSNFNLPSGGTFKVMTYQNSGSNLTIGAANTGLLGGYGNRIQILRTA